MANLAATQSVLLTLSILGCHAMLVRTGLQNSEELAIGENKQLAAK
jgi:hypothetical protein